MVQIPGMKQSGKRHYIGPGRRPAEYNEVEALLETCRQFHPMHELAFLLACDAGMRRREISSCRICHFQGQRLQIPFGKGNVSRYSVVTPRMKRALDISLSFPRKEKYGDLALQIGYSHLKNLFLDCRERAGLPHDLTFHCLRHYFAMRLIRGGVAIQEVSAIMGHRWVYSTMSYLHIAPDRFERAIDALESPAPAKLGGGMFRVINGGMD